MSTVWQGSEADEAAVLVDILGAVVFEMIEQSCALRTSSQTEPGAELLAAEFAKSTV